MRLADDISAYEGLVRATASRYVGTVDLEYDDLLQELRLKILTARRAYDRTRSRMTERAFVFMAVTNRVKDLKRDSAARRRRRQDVFVEDEVDASDLEHLAEGHDEVFGAVDEGLFRLPATLTEFEREVVILLTLDFNQREVAERLEVGRQRVRLAVTTVREKMADWRPDPLAPVIPLPEILDCARPASQQAA